MAKPYRKEANLRCDLIGLEKQLEGLCLEGLSTVQLERLVEDDNDRDIFTRAIVGQSGSGKKSPVEAWRTVAALDLK